MKTSVDPDVMLIDRHYHVPTEHVDFGKMMLQLLLVMAALYAMTEPVTAPLRLVTTYLHEMGHALAALATGGSVQSVLVAVDEGGSAVSEGGITALVLAAGYTFSGLMGALTLAGSGRPSWAGPACIAVIGVSLLGGVAFALDRSTQQLAFVLAAGALAVGFLCWGRLTWPLGTLALRTAGTYWCLHTMFDLYADVWGAPAAPGPSDAVALAQLTGLPAQVSAVLGLLILGALTACAAVWSVLITPPRIQVRRA